MIRPQTDRHSIWEQVLHCAYWKYTVRRRLLGEKRGSFPLKGSNWFTPERTTVEAWRDAQVLLNEVHVSLRGSIAELPPGRLHRRLGTSKMSPYALITGIAAHDAYHAGQIQLLKRMVRTR